MAGCSASVTLVFDRPWRDSRGSRRAPAPCRREPTVTPSHKRRWCGRLLVDAVGLPRGRPVGKELDPHPGHAAPIPIFHVGRAAPVDGRHQYGGPRVRAGKGRCHRRSRRAGRPHQDGDEDGGDRERADETPHEHPRTMHATPVGPSNLDASRCVIATGAGGAGTWRPAGAGLPIGQRLFDFSRPVLESCDRHPNLARVEAAPDGHAVDRDRHRQRHDHISRPTKEGESVCAPPNVDDAITPTSSLSACR